MTILFFTVLIVTIATVCFLAGYAAGHDYRSSDEIFHDRIRAAWPMMGDKVIDKSGKIVDYENHIP